MKITDQIYDDLSIVEAIRKRPGMYIGKMDSKGFINLFEEICTELINDFHFDWITFKLGADKIGELVFTHKEEVDIRDLVNYIPRKHPSYVGGLAILNPLSASFTISYINAQQQVISKHIFTKGNLIKGIPFDSLITIQKIVVNFNLDPIIWDNLRWDKAFILNQINQFAYLNSNAVFEVLYDYYKACRVIYHYPNGLLERLLLEKLNGLGNIIFDTYIKEKINDISVEIAFAFRNSSVDEAVIRSFVNNKSTHENGTHVDALLKGITYGVMQYFQANDLVDQYKISEKGISQCLVAFINVDMENPRFVGCTKNKLGSTEIVEPITNYISDLLYQKIKKNAKTTERLVSRSKM